MNFNNKTFLKYDDYETPKSAWVSIKHYIPKNKVIWEPFYCNGKSGDDLKSLGFNVIHEKEDFFSNNKGDVVISNPPFSLKKEVINKLVEIDKPFILIMPCSTLTTQYVRKIFENQDERLKIIIPKKRIQFKKSSNGKTNIIQKNQCNFDCFYFCWKIDTIKNDITWLK